MKKIDIINNISSNILKKTYKPVIMGLRTGKIKEDNDAAEIIGCDTDDGKFKMFKMRLRNTLLNSLFFLDMNIRKSSEMSKELYKCSRNQHCIRILGLLSARKTAMYIAKKTLNNAKEYEFTDIIIYCARVLRTYSSHLGNKKDFKLYNEIVTKYNEIQLVEDKSRGYFEDINIKYAKSKALKPKFSVLAKNYADDLKKLKQKYNTFLLNLNYHRVQSLSYLIVQDYINALKVWQSLENYVNSFRKFDYEMRLGEIYLQQLNCYLHLRDYSNGAVCAEKCATLFSAGSNNWFVFNEMYFLLAIQSKNYVAAKNVLKEVTLHPRFEFQPDIKKETWEAFKIYLIFITSTYIKEEINTNDEDKFYLQLLEKAPVFFKDKEGYNLSLKIIPYLYFLERGKHRFFSSNIEGIKRYSSRYFKKDYSYRGNVFLNMLIEMEKTNFNYEETLANTSLLLKRLNNSKMIHTDQLESLEIIPFEDLWERALFCIKK